MRHSDEGKLGENRSSVTQATSTVDPKGIFLRPGGRPILYVKAGTHVKEFMQYVLISFRLKAIFRCECNSNVSAYWSMFGVWRGQMHAPRQVKDSETGVLSWRETWSLRGGECESLYDFICHTYILISGRLTSYLPLHQTP